MELGRGNRSRKETNYDYQVWLAQNKGFFGAFSATTTIMSFQLSEREWLKAIGAENEEGDFEDDEEDEVKPSKKGRGKGKA